MLWSIQFTLYLKHLLEYKIQSSISNFRRMEKDELCGKNYSENELAPKTWPATFKNRNEQILGIINYRLLGNEVLDHYSMCCTILSVVHINFLLRPLNEGYSVEEYMSPFICRWWRHELWVCRVYKDLTGKKSFEQNTSKMPNKFHESSCISFWLFLHFCAVF